MIRYEWLVETIEADDEHNDICDVWHFDTFRAARKVADELIAEGWRVEVGLVRDQINNIDEDIDDRQWAYLEDGALPKEFDRGAKVPARFRKETA